MKEIIVKNNKTELKVFVNGEPDFDLIPIDELQSVVSTLELKITDYYNKNNEIL